MMRPLGVAIVCEGVDFQAGMERQALRLAKGLAERGVRVVVVTTYSPPGFGLPLPSRPPRREHRDGYEIVRVPMLRWWSGEAVRALFALALARVLVSRRVDVVYSVQWQAAVHVDKVVAVGRWPTVMKIACGGEYGDLAQVSRRKESAEILERLGRVDRYACLSRQVEEEIERAGLPRERVFSVRNGVDRSRFSPEGPRATLPPGKWIVFLGRHDSQKRLDVLLRAFALIKVPEARLALAGQGPDLAKLEALARELGISARVSFLGERRDVPELLRAASVFVLPSAAEGLPNALLEALSTGVPSVVTDIPGTNEVVSPEREALMVPLDDAPALARALERALTDEALRERLVKAGHERIAREFDMDAVTDAHLRLFMSMKGETQPVNRRRLVGLSFELAKALLVGWFYALGRRLFRT